MTTKNEHPALFAAPMVRAIGSGQKTQTRRIVKPQPIGIPWVLEGDEEDPTQQWFDGFERGRDSDGAPIEEVNKPMRSPYGQPGDRIWVRETWALLRGVTELVTFEGQIPECRPTREHPILGLVPVPFYRADDDCPTVLSGNGIGKPWKWRPSIHMPRWAARYLLDVTAVRVERLQDISEEDARAEGVEEWAKSEDGFAALRGLGFAIPTAPRFLFQLLWTSIYGAESWDANPWVWVVEFKAVTP